MPLEATPPRTTRREEAAGVALLVDLAAVHRDHVAAVDAYLQQQQQPAAAAAVDDDDVTARPENPCRDGCPTLLAESEPAFRTLSVALIKRALTSLGFYVDRAIEAARAAAAAEASLRLRAAPADQRKGTATAARLAALAAYGKSGTPAVSGSGSRVVLKRPFEDDGVPAAAAAAPAAAVNDFPMPALFYSSSPINPASLAGSALVVGADNNVGEGSVKKQQRPRSEEQRRRENEARRLRYQRARAEAAARDAAAKAVLEREAARVAAERAEVEEREAFEREIEANAVAAAAAAVAKEERKRAKSGGGGGDRKDKKRLANFMAAVRDKQPPAAPAEDQADDDK